MNNELLQLLDRIKGAKLYVTPHGMKVYFPYVLDYAPRKVHVKSYFAVVNDRLNLFVKVSSKDCSTNWCKMETARLTELLRREFHELLYDCEAKHRKISLKVRLKDNIRPLSDNIDESSVKALNFLCGMKISALIGENQLQRWLISIRLAQCRFNNDRINHLIAFIPCDLLENYQTFLYKHWQDPNCCITFFGIEQLSHCNDTHYNTILDQINEETMLIVDDCHLFKTPETNRSNRIVQLASRCNYKLIMTHSLITGQIHDMYMQYRILSETILGYYQWSDFSKKHIIYGGIDKKQILCYKNLAHLIDATAPYTYAIEANMPTKQSLDIQTHLCNLTETQENHYQRKKQELIRKIEQGNFQTYDVFRWLTEMQKIACGHIPKLSCRTSWSTNKLSLLNQVNSTLPCVILCKYLFEINMLTDYLREENCAILTDTTKEERMVELIQFKGREKKYLISTLGMSQSYLKNIEGPFEVIFFSLSFKFSDYQRCITLLENNTQKGAITVRLFFTNTGVDRYIQRTMEVKNDLAGEITSLFRDKTGLKQFVEIL
ncbi:MAG: hypothetical protein EZS26_002157 [Candidatus Ordinivivax streblomastigis]|uniref:Uncharacterized protein n=1 Tax=Candidatus Ordinivivax streblomastigis TaxID=2540710 RepID=A0A5M8NZX4_9BACT|nr:MAG: hypothetical protein EZS26_002157 [Candidatus Ordinivivax streblomastigis]